MPTEIDQIKERIGVVELIGEYLKLEKAGTNYKGLCPFHNEKTPSFMVNPERNFWYCFGCQKGGDVFTFVQEMEGVNFIQSLHRLAERAGVALPKFSFAHKQKQSEKQRLFEILKLSAQFYKYQLQKHAKGGKILEYLGSRKILDEQIAHFNIGYAPEGWRNVMNFLSKKGYAIGEISKTGLLVQKEGGHSQPNANYDRFRERIMFPIIDVVGNVVGFSARVSPGENESVAKYINTPETSVYNKSSVLYGLYQSKTAIKKADFVIIVEGNMDVIASHCAGVKNVVAVSGTALTEQQVQLIKRYTQNAKLCFDMDDAGQKAAKKSIRTCLLGGLELEIILLPEGFKDVGDLVEKEPKQWQAAVQNSIPVMEYYFKSALSKHNPQLVKDKKMIARELLNIIKDVADPIEQSYWLKKLSSLIQIDEEVLTGILEKGIVEQKREQRRQAEASPKAQGEASKKQSKKPRKTVLEELILGLFYLHRNQLEKLSSELDQSMLNHDFLEIWQSLFSDSEKKYSEDLERLSLNVKYRADDKEGFVENEIDPVREWRMLIKELKNETRRQKMKKIIQDIRRAEEGGDEEAADLMIQELMELQKES